jgi:hypothetical protein
VDVNLLRKIIFAFPPWEGTYSGDVLNSHAVTMYSLCPEKNATMCCLSPKIVHVWPNLSEYYSYLRL